MISPTTLILILIAGVFAGAAIGVLASLAWFLEIETGRPPVKPPQPTPPAESNWLQAQRNELRQRYYSR